MAKIRLSTKDPAPKWWRKFENLSLIILIPAITFTITKWGFKDEQFVNRLLLLINVPLTAVIKGIGFVLSNGETYTKSYSAPNDQEQQNKVQ